MRPKAKSPLPYWPACASVASRVGGAYAPRAECAPARAPQQCRKHEKGGTGQKTRCPSSLRNGCHAAPALHATPALLEETIKLRRRRATFTGGKPRTRLRPARARPAALQGCQLSNARLIDAGPKSCERLLSRPRN